MHIERRNNNKYNKQDVARILVDLLGPMAAHRALRVAFDPSDSGRVPARPRQQSRCPPVVSTCQDQVSKDTRDAQNAANRTGLYRPVIAALGVGLSSATPAPFVAVGGSIDTAHTLGRWRTIYLTDLVTTLTLPDTALVQVQVSGVTRVSFFAGRFARGNANECTTACGIVVCAGAFEAVEFIVTNLGAAAYGAADTLTVETRTVYSGEEGFKCDTDGSCTTPKTSCGPCDGGEVNVDVDVTTGFDPVEVG